MKAVQIRKFGGPEVLEVVDLPMPEPKAGEVLVKMAYAGVNFTDIYRRSGHYAESPTYPTKLPVVLGLEGSGTVAAIGAGVAGLTPGVRVAFTRGSGAYAGHANVPARCIARIPDGLPLDVAAASMTHGMTAHYLSHEFGLKAGDTCLVHAGAGGVGQMLIQLAKMRNVRVIATAGTSAKAAIARGRGADEVILYRDTDFREAVRKLTNGRGVDVVFDSVGKDTIHGSLYSLRPRGICVLYGHTSGKVDHFDTMDLAEAGSVFLTRPHMQHYVATPEEYARRANDVLRWVTEGRLKVTIQKKYRLEEVAAAHAAMAGRQTTGKLLLDVQAQGPGSERPHVSHQRL